MATITNNNPFLTPTHNSDYLRCEAIFRRVWTLTEQEQEVLDSHFLLRTNVATFLDNMYQSEKNYYRDTLDVGRVTMDVEYMNTSGTVLIEQYQKCGRHLSLTMDLLVSCRILNFRNFAACIVQPRYPSMKAEKFLSLGEYEGASSLEGMADKLVKQE